MKWILLFYILGGAQPHIVAVEFDSYNQCQFGGKWLAKQSRNYSTTFTCLEKK